jgi:hypothetical protein
VTKKPLALETLALAINTNNPAHRQQLLATVWAPDGLMRIDDEVVADGRAALAAMIDTWHSGGWRGVFVRSARRVTGREWRPARRRRIRPQPTSANA